MNQLTRSKCILIGIFSLVVSSVSAVESRNDYINQELGFSFKYNMQWRTVLPVTSNSTVKVVSPADTPQAECSVVIQRYPQAATVSQRDIDQVFLKSPSPSELKSALSQGANDVEILSVSSGVLHQHPAHFARTNFNIGTPTGIIFGSGRLAMTATPGVI